MAFQQLALAIEVDEEMEAEWSSATDSKGDAYTALVLEHRESGRKLARSILRKWRVRMPAEETDSIVDLTLCEAAARYSDDKGASFMTFFFYHLRGNLVRAVTAAAKANQFVVAFAKNAGMDVSEWSRVNDGYAWALLPEYSIFHQADSEAPDNKLLRQESILGCRDAVSQLDELEQEILRRSYADEQPLVDIARALGYSRCHVSRVKKRALARLGAILREDGASVVEHDEVPVTVTRESTISRTKSTRRTRTPKSATRRTQRRIAA